jgi:hypothetical protein
MAEMSWLHRAQHHVGTAQVVLDEVGRGLAAAERVEVAAEHAVPVLRTVAAVVVGCAVGAGLYVLVVRPALRRRRPPEGRWEDPDPVGDQL